MIRYRPDVDGLRGVAIIPIVLFHAGISQLAGGFVGVDIFFVISGFLITSIILKDHQAGTFSLLTFYRRRIVRIFPALFAMLFVVTMVGTTLLPAEFRQLSHSAIATMVFGANIFFWRETDYFAMAAEIMPLLHTWSLGLEEQFYLFYPLVMIWVLGGRFVTRLRSVLLALAIGSFAVGVLFAIKSPTASFYLLPSRAWELLAGAVVAVGGLPSLAYGARRNAALAGACMILLSIVFLRADSGFPIPWALLPCVGTMLIIGYGEGGPVGKILTSPSLRWIGRISYSTYLWHWPIIAFYRLHTGIELDRHEAVLLTGASLGMGALSYYTIEQPFLRRFRQSSSDRRVLAVGGSVIVSSIAAVSILVATSAQWRYVDPTIRQIASYVDYRTLPEYEYQFRRGPCFRGGAEDGVSFEPDVCTGISQSQPNVVVVGDSHAAQYWRALTLRYSETNVMQATASGCRPLVGTGGEARCREVVDYALGPLLATGEIQLVVLAARWDRTELDALMPTIEHIRRAGSQVIVLGPTIEYQGEFPSILARAMYDGDASEVARWRIPEREILDREMAQMLAGSEARYVSVQSILCSNGLCRLQAPDGIPMQFDYGHLSWSGAQWLVNEMPSML